MTSALVTAGRIAFGCTALVSQAVLGQQPPDAGQIRQEIERRPVPRQPVPAPPGGALPPPVEPAPADASGIVVVLQRVEFSGNTLLNDATLQRVVASYLARPLRFSDLQRAASDIATRYRLDGWVVRTSLPEQDLGDGTLRILITEGRFGRVVIDAAQAGDPPRVPMARILALVSGQLRPGQLLRSSDIDAAIRVIDELPGIRAQGHLEPGAEEGRSDLRLQVAGEPLATGTWGVDNQGGRSTGVLRVLGSMTLASPFRQAERMTLATMASDGNRYARAAVQWPAGRFGTRAGWSGSWLGYRLTDGSVEALGAMGRSTTLGFDLSQPLVQASDQAWSIGAAAERKSFHNEAAGAVTSAYRVGSLQVTAGGYRSDAVLGGGTTGLNAVVTRGRVELDGSPNAAADAEGARTAGLYTKLRWSLSRQQRLTGSLSMNASWTAQWADRNLDSSEKFYLGGPTGVRAYPGGEAGGPEGHLLALELLGTWRPGVSASAFVDRGAVQAESPQGAWVPPGPARTRLQGVGSAISWSPSPHVNAKLTWSRRVGLNPNPTATGADQDGTRRIHRVWLELAGSF